jgi:beta-glucosidase
MLALGTACAQGQQHPFPWMNTSLTPDERADLVLKELTLDEKIDLIHGQGWPPSWPYFKPNPNALLSNGGDGFALGVPRLGIPSLQTVGSAIGVRFSAANGRYSTALPSTLAASSSWDTEAACEYGALIGRELRAQGYNMSLAGGVNITRELRSERTFEYLGEDSILAGTLVGNRVRCEQAQHVIGELKHFAVYDQGTAGAADSVISKRVMRETDLLAFEIGNEIGQPHAYMCSYNSVNGDYACENKYLLADVLRKEWGFKGFVISDWGATHSTLKASAAGLDMEQPDADFYGEAMKKAVVEGKVPMAELDEHVHRLLRTEFLAGVIDFPMRRSVVDVEGGLAIARNIAEESIVLLKNAHGLLPLDRAKVTSIAIIGNHADFGMISGGGSAQVDAQGQFAPLMIQKDAATDAVWFPTSPLKAVAAMAPGTQVRFASGADPAAAAALAKQSQVAIVFAHQWTAEGFDLPNLSLPGKQDQLIEQVAAANPNTIVVLETGTAVTMPWAGHVSGIVEAWYAGSKGADAVANVLFGQVNPSAKLPITFPVSEADLPHPQLAVPPSGGAKFTLTYDEGLKVGYKWYDAEKKPVLFPFGFGLSYTTYSYSGMTVSQSPAGAATVSFTVKNTGNREGTEIAEVYASLPPSTTEPPNRLVGWSRVTLKPGESREVSIAVSAEYLSVFDEIANDWMLIPGIYTFRVGGSSRDLPLMTSLALH